MTPASDLRPCPSAFPCRLKHDNSSTQLCDPCRSACKTVGALLDFLWTSSTSSLYNFFGFSHVTDVLGSFGVTDSTAYKKQQRVSLFISFYNQYSSHDPSCSVSVQLVLSPCCHTHRDRMRQNATHVSRFWCHRFNHNQPRLFLLPSSFAFGASTLVQHPPSGVLSLEIGPLLGGNIGGR